MTPVPEELAVVRRILDLWHAGQSTRTIAAKLNQDGLPTKQGARWHHTTVVRVLRRRSWYAERLTAS